MDNTRVGGSLLLNTRNNHQGRDITGLAGGVELWKALAQEQIHIINTLRFSEEKFSKAFLSSPCAMFISLLDDGRIIEVNDSFCSITGYSRDQILGLTSVGLQIWDNSEDREHFVREIMEKGFISNREIFFRESGGKERCGLISSEVLNFHDQVFLITALVDISEHKQLMRKLDQIAQVNMVAELAASLAHEVRNPMTTVRGFLQIMAEKQQYSGDRADIELMLAELDRANRIISEFLFVARDKGLDLQIQSLNQVIEDLKPLLDTSATVQEKNIILDLQENPAFFMDEKEIKQLIINLVQNGLEAILPGHTLRVSTRRVKGETHLLGEGMGPSGSSREPREKGSHAQLEFGTGLGLALSHSIAARHHATIQVKDCSQGTIFQVRFRV